MAEVRRRWRPSGATLGLAVAIGVILAAATLLEPVRAWHRALTRPAISDALLSADPAERAEAWASLEETWRDAETRAAALAEFDGFLEQSFRDGDPPEEPVAELAMRVDRFAPWRWERPIDRDVLVRTVAWAARPSEQPADPALLAFAAERLIELPDSLAFPLAPAAAASLWNRLDAPMQSRLLPRLVSLAPQSRRDLLTRFDLPKEPRAAGLLLLARLSVEQDLESATDRAHDRSHSPPLRDRAAASLTRLEPLAAIGLLAHLDDDPSAPWATILAPAAADPAVRAALETRTAADDAAARRLLARIDAAANGEPPESEALAAAWDLLSDPGSPPQARRLAALVLVERTGEELPESALANLLDGSLADDDGSVLASVLLAEATGRARRATSWLRSLEDDRKRAGAMLAVLTDGRHGADRAAIARTQDAASDPTVRSLLRTASWSLASPRDFGARDADREFVHRVSHRVSSRGEQGELDLDVLAMRLASGDPAAVDALLTMSEDPDDDLPDSIRRWSARQSMRWLLVERFVPTLAASLGAPLGGSRRERSLQADLALVEWWSSRHRLRFDPATRRWVERRESTSGPALEPYVATGVDRVGHL